MGKFVHELTDAELIAEWWQWNNEISTATGWGAALAAADEFRRDCAREMERRRVAIPNEEIAP